jgi:hypothetical protein
MSNDNDCCQICGGSLDDGYCRAFEVFEKSVGPVCFACMNVPAQPSGWKRGDSRPLYSVDEIMTFGWDKREAKFHLRAVKRFFHIGTPRKVEASPKSAS